MVTMGDVRHLAGLLSEIEGSPLATGVHFGCDCGCGGDSYTDEEWDQETEDYCNAIKELDELCEELDIDNDL